MSNMMAAMLNIGGTNEEQKFRNSLPFLSYAAKFGWRLLLECRAVMLPI